jgi:hypothetical protein
MVPLSTLPGVDIIGGLTQVPINDGLPTPNAVSGGTAALSGTTTGSPTSKNNPQTVYYLIAVLLILVALRYLTEHEKSRMDVHLVGIGVYNWLIVGLLAVTFEAASKAILNRYYVKGVTELFNAA